MTKRAFVFAAISMVFLAIFNSGCESPTTAPTAPGSIKVVNNSKFDIRYVYISKTNAASWGYDCLDSTEMIVSGASRVFDGIDVGEYDLRVESELMDTAVVDASTESGFKEFIGYSEEYAIEISSGGQYIFTVSYLQH